MKKTKKVCVNLTEEEYNLLNKLSQIERRNISELAALLLVDNATEMFLSKQEKGTMEIAKYNFKKW